MIFIQLIILNQSAQKVFVQLKSDSDSVYLRLRGWGGFVLPMISNGAIVIALNSEKNIQFGALHRCYATLSLWHEIHYYFLISWHIWDISKKHNYRTLLKYGGQ